MLDLNSLPPFDISPTKIEDVSHKGYSGSLIYKVSSANNNYVLKGYQPGFTAERIRFVHQVLDFSYKHGFCYVPIVHRNMDGESIVLYHDRYWECLSLLDGEELVSVPTQTQTIQLGNLAHCFISLCKSSLKTK